MNSKQKLHLFNIINIIMSENIKVNCLIILILTITSTTNEKIY